MNPVSPIGSWHAGPTSRIDLPALTLGQSAGAAALHGTAGAGAATGLAGAGRAGDIHAAVGQFLQALGGGLQDDQTLRMILGLIILMALLDKTGKQSEAGSEMLNNLGRLASSLSGAGTATSIEIHQSSTIIVASQSTTISAVRGGSGSLDSYA